jgi:hypothetical protein
MQRKVSRGAGATGTAGTDVAATAIGADVTVPGCGCATTTCGAVTGGGIGGRLE